MSVRRSNFPLNPDCKVPEVLLVMEIRIVPALLDGLLFAANRMITEKRLAMCSEPLHGHLVQTTTLLMMKEDPHGKTICTP